jgi:COP9 signalosome complex subunit 7
MTKKLRLLTLASMASKEKLIAYSDLQKSLHIESVRELEDLIIEGANQNVVQGKLDQMGRHFEVDYSMARDIQKVSGWNWNQLSSGNRTPPSASCIL